MIMRANGRLRVAVPKGSLFAGSLDVLGGAGLDIGPLRDLGRHLIVSTNDVDYYIVRPTDVPTFVANGGADCAICGKDTLLESDLPVVELVDLAFGGCRFVVAEPAGASGAIEARYRHVGVLRVATKYPRITAAYYDSIGVQADIVKLHGNVELAALVGLADRIVDITATGTTLRENDLVVVDDVLDSTARFVANPASLRTDPRVSELAASLEEYVGLRPGKDGIG